MGVRLTLLLCQCLSRCLALCPKVLSIEPVVNELLCQTLKTFPLSEVNAASLADTLKLLEALLVQLAFHEGQVCNCGHIEV